MLVYCVRNNYTLPPPSTVILFHVCRYDCTYRPKTQGMPPCDLIPLFAVLEFQALLIDRNNGHYLVAKGYSFVD